MVFNSITFGVFFCLVFVGYWFLSKRRLIYQNIFLLLASYSFYAWWDFRFLLLILISSLTDFWVGIQLSKTSEKKRRKILLAYSLVVNLGLLGLFKYFNFFLDSLVLLFNHIGFQPNLPTLQFILPVGISFYTFQTLSYSIDVYRNKLPACKQIIPFFAYVAFFPQLVAGPIERATNLLPQFLKARNFNFPQAVEGCRFILWGLFKKIVIADRLAPFVDQIFQNPQDTSGFGVVLACIAFALQIYGDFSGYSDIAIGIARLLGFRLMDNFKTPYFATSLQAFWRRWHISLSTWFRDYVFIPLGGSRSTTGRVIFNILLTFLISGLWHGANYTFLIWGLIHGVLFAIEWLIRQKQLLKYQFPSWLKGLWVFSVVCVTWLFFRAENMETALQMLDHLLHWEFGQRIPLLFSSLIEGNLFAFALILFVVLEIRIGTTDANTGFIKLPRILRWMLYYLLVILILLLGRFDNAPTFIYFQF